MTSRRLRRVLLVLLALGAAGGCARDARPATHAAAMAAPALLPVDALDADLALRQQVTARYGEREDSFEAVLEKRPGELRLVGLGPMGTVAFHISHSAQGVRFENRTGRDVPFEPDHIVADVQRVFYPWLAEDACDDCTREGEVSDLRVIERFEGGRLVERRFRLASDEARGEILVDFQGWSSDGRVPTRVVLTNGWYGYGLTITSTDLGGAAPDEARDDGA